MEFVEPIRDKKKIAQIKNQLRGAGRFRDLLLFTVGINTALRVSDLLTLQVKDLIDTSGEPTDYFFTREKKTNKGKRVNVNDTMKETFQQYLAAYPHIIDNPDNFLFFNVKSENYAEPIKRGMVWILIADICQEVGLRGNYGTHTLRKTWGYHARMSGTDMGIIMEMFQHSSINVTKRYLGITDDELADVVNRLNL